MIFATADEMRRWYGSALDLWFARTETPSRVVLEQSRVKLRDYGNDGKRPCLLIIPAPIKKPYIWDLTPSASVVLACLQGRFRVYVLEWTEGDRDNGLAVYVDELILECAKVLVSPPSWLAILLVALSPRFSPRFILSACVASFYLKRR